MPRPASPVLTDAELRLMKVLWERGPSTTSEVVLALSGEVSLAESTVRTMLGILRDKGYVDASPRGRAIVYGPRIDRAEAQRSVVRHLIRRFFDGSAGDLVLNVLREEDLDESEIRELRRMIEEGETYG